MSYVFCNRCGHRNPPTSAFCSACGSVLDRIEEHTITLAKVDPHQDAPGDSDDVRVSLDEIKAGKPILVLRGGDDEGDFFVLSGSTTSIGRHSDCDIVLDDITVSRRHTELFSDGHSRVVRDTGSLNGTYVNQQRIDESRLEHGDELQIGKFRLVFFESTDDLP